MDIFDTSHDKIQNKNSELGKQVENKDFKHYFFWTTCSPVLPSLYIENENKKDPPQKIKSFTV